MGNVTHILPVLHCLKRGIAFISSFVKKITLIMSIILVKERDSAGDG